MRVLGQIVGEHGLAVGEDASEQAVGVGQQHVAGAQLLHRQLRFVALRQVGDGMDPQRRCLTLRQYLADQRIVAVGQLTQRLHQEGPQAIAGDQRLVVGDPLVENLEQRGLTVGLGNVVGDAYHPAGLTLIIL